MEKIIPTHKASWKVTKALKTEESQCSHAFPPHDIAHINHVEKEILHKASLEPKDYLLPVLLGEVKTLVKSLKTRKAPGVDGEADVIGIHEPGKSRDLPISYRPINLLSGLGKVFERILKSYLSNHLLGKGLIIDEQFGFRPAHSCPQQVFRLVEHERTYLTRRPIRARGPIKAPPSIPCCTPRTQMIHRDRRPASNSRYSPTILRSITGIGINNPPSSTSGGPFRNWRIEINPKKSAAIQFKYSKYRSRHIVDLGTPRLKRLNANIPWQCNYKYLGVTFDKNLHFRNQNRKLQFSTERDSEPCSVEKANYLDAISALSTKCALGRDLELPIISKYMKDASKRFFDIAGSHPNELLRAAVNYEPPQSKHFIRRLRNVLNDPPDALTALVESLNEVNDTHV
ncbi:Probable RNA-directed DNA polymerase from transposon X-element [Eumeta japonica]|uniref:Probable RNA-directed DNA polymerase from transposon X-element n=1 Tax=Eumeta variegata TaxID=151549 RepID=A0A4C1ZLH4_EUMVA|nr:Probable RNA-directed DNA polymerase from transposon X-element [Eumeta japonica]